MRRRCRLCLCALACLAGPLGRHTIARRIHRHAVCAELVFTAIRTGTGAAAAAGRLHMRVLHAPLLAAVRMRHCWHAARCIRRERLLRRGRLLCLYVPATEGGLGVRVGPGGGSGSVSCRGPLGRDACGTRLGLYHAPLLPSGPLLGACLRASVRQQPRSARARGTPPEQRRSLTAVSEAAVAPTRRHAAGHVPAAAAAAAAAEGSR
eukprot:364798-Chlamydomonas_euryale.AAC.2